MLGKKSGGDNFEVMDRPAETSQAPATSKPALAKGGGFDVFQPTSRRKQLDLKRGKLHQ
jgi:hypothetical protein